MQKRTRAAGLLGKDMPGIGKIPKGGEKILPVWGMRLSRLRDRRYADVCQQIKKVCLSVWLWKNVAGSQETIVILSRPFRAMFTTMLTNLPAVF